MSRCTLAWLCLVLLGACAKNNPRPSHVSEDGGRDSATACEAQREHLSSLYQAAAEAEAMPANLQPEFVSSLVHMVMRDCQEAPAKVVACLGKSESVRDIETQCLLPLDDAGEAEAKRFAIAP